MGAKIDEPEARRDKVVIEFPTTQHNTPQTLHSQPDTLASLKRAWVKH